MFHDEGTTLYAMFADAIAIYAPFAIAVTVTLVVSVLFIGKLFPRVDPSKRPGPAPSA